MHWQFCGTEALKLAGLLGSVRMIIPPRMLCRRSTCKSSFYLTFTFPEVEPFRVPCSAGFAAWGLFCSKTNGSSLLLEAPAITSCLQRPAYLLTTAWWTWFRFRFLKPDILNKTKGSDSNRWHPEATNTTVWPKEWLYFERMNVENEVFTCPLPKRPCVSTRVMTLIAPRSTCRNSYTLRLICFFGHQAPPFFSVLILK